MQKRLYTFLNIIYNHGISQDVTGSLCDTVSPSVRSVGARVQTFWKFYNN